MAVLCISQALWLLIAVFAATSRAQPIALVLLSRSGNDVRLQCRDLVNLATLNTAFWLNDTRIEGIPQTVANELDVTIQPATEGDYSCGDMPRESTIVQLVADPRLVVHPPIPTQHIANLMQPVTIPCGITRGALAQRYSAFWFRGESRTQALVTTTTPSNGRYSLNLDNFSLTVQNASLANTGERGYSCEVRVASPQPGGLFSAVGPLQVLTAFGAVEIVEGPQSVVAIESTNEDACSAVFRCRANGVPTPNVVWLMDGLAITDLATSGKYVLETIATDPMGPSVTDQLSIRQIRNSDSGHYTCRYSNQADGGPEVTMSANSTLTVLPQEIDASFEEDEEEGAIEVSITLPSPLRTAFSIVSKFTDSTTGRVQFLDPFSPEEFDSRSITYTIDRSEVPFQDSEFTFQVALEIDDLRTQFTTKEAFSPLIAPTEALNLPCAFTSRQQLILLTVLLPVVAFLVVFLICFILLFLKIFKTRQINRLYEEIRIHSQNEAVRTHLIKILCKKHGITTDSAAAESELSLDEQEALLHLEAFSKSDKFKAALRARCELLAPPPYSEEDPHQGGVAIPIGSHDLSRQSHDPASQIAVELEALLEQLPPPHQMPIEAGSHDPSKQSHDLVSPAADSLNGRGQLNRLQTGDGELGGNADIELPELKHPGFESSESDPQETMSPKLVPPGMEILDPNPSGTELRPPTTLREQSVVSSDAGDLDNAETPLLPPPQFPIGGRSHDLNTQSHDQARGSCEPTAVAVKQQVSSGSTGSTHPLLGTYPSDESTPL